MTCIFWLFFFSFPLVNSLNSFLFRVSNEKSSKLSNMRNDCQPFKNVLPHKLLQEMWVLEFFFSVQWFPMKSLQKIGNCPIWELSTFQKCSTTSRNVKFCIRRLKVFIFPWSFIYNWLDQWEFYGYKIIKIIL